MLPRGLLLIAPREDRLVSWTESRALFERAREPKELFVVPGAGHSEARSVAGAAYVERVLGFLGSHLDGERQPDGAARRGTSVRAGASPV